MKKLIYSFVVFFLVFSGALRADITTGLVAHYEFEDDVNDTSNSTIDYNGTVNGSFSYDASGKFGKAGSFNGTDSYIVTNRPVQDDFSYSFWIKTTMSGYGTVAWEADQLFDLDASGDDNDFSIGIATGGKLAFGTGDTTAFYNGLSTTSVNTSNWVHVVVTRTKSTGENKIYLNGVLETTVTGSIQSLTAQSLMGIGEKSTYSYRKYNGLMDEVRIYDRVLSQNDISELYNYPKKLTLEAYGGVVQFDGNTSYVDLGTTSNLKIDSNLTVEMWVYKDTWNTPAENKHFISNAENSGYAMGITAGGTLYGTFYIGGEYRSVSTSIDNMQNGWNHVAITYDGDYGQIYLNGTAQMGTPMTFTGTISYLGSESTVLGAEYASGGNTNFFDGMIDELRIWNTARTSSEINATMNQQLDGNETGLVAYYNFDERLGDTVKDISGNSNDGTINGNVQRLNFLGDSLSFDGVSTYVNLTNTTTLKPTSELSVGLWFDYNGTVSATYDSLISNYQGDGYAIDLASTGYLRAVVNNGTAITAEYPQSSLIVGWNHAVFTYDQTDGLVLYINGQQVAQNTSTGLLTYSDTTVSTIIGAEAGSNDTIDSTRMYNGKIAEVSIWNKSLSLTEVKQLMASPLDTTDSNLLGYWPLNEGSGTTANDLSTNANDGTITGSTWVDTAPTIYGDTIYTSQDIISNEKLVVENNSTTPTYSYNGTAPSEILSFGSSGDFVYKNGYISTDTLDINADDNGTTLNSVFDVVVYQNPNYSRVDISLENVNLSEHNITSVILLKDDETYSYSVSDIYDGTNSLTMTVKQSGDYLLKFLTSDGQEWYYNFSDSSVDATIDGTINYKTTISTDVTYTINAVNTNWENRAPLIHGINEFVDLNLQGTASYTTLTKLATAISPNGIPYIAYSDGGPIKVYRYQNNIWQSLGVAASPDAANAGKGIGIAVGNDEMPAVVYNNAHPIYVSQYNGSSWNILSDIAVDLGGISVDAYRPSISVDYDGTIVIGWYNHPEGYKNHIATFDGTGWSEVGDITTIVGAGGGYALDIKVDNGDIYVLRHVGTNTHLAKWNGSFWSQIGDTILSDNPQEASIGIGDDGLLYVVVKDGTGTIYTKEYDSYSNTWIDITNISELSDSVSYVDVDVDSYGKPILTYIDTNATTGQNRLSLKRYNGSSWVDSSAGEFITDSTTTYSSIMLNSFDEMFLTYSKDSNLYMDIFKKELSTYIVENTTTVMTISASDPDSDTLTYTLSGTDASLFSIDSSGNITFNTAPDYEIPKDLNTDNSYEFIVSVDDGIESVSKNVAVIVTDDPEVETVDLGALGIWEKAKYYYNYESNTLIDNGDYSTMSISKISGTQSILSLYRATDDSITTKMVSMDVDLTSIDTSSFLIFKAIDTNGYTHQILLNSQQALASIFAGSEEIRTENIFYQDTSNPFFAQRVRLNMWAQNGTTYFNITDTNYNQIGKTIHLYSVGVEGFVAYEIVAILDSASTLSKMKFDLYQITDSDTLANTYHKRFPMIENKITTTTYDDAVAEDANGSVWYDFEANTYSSDNEYFNLKVGQINPIESLVNETEVLIDIDGVVKSDKKDKFSVGVLNNIITLSSDEGDEEVKYIGALTSTELNNIISSNSIDTSFTFSGSAGGYKLYLKRETTSCEIHYTDSYRTDYSGTSDIISSYSYDSNSTFQNFINHNNYDNLRVLAFSDTTPGDLVEVSLIDNTISQTNAGTSTIVPNVTCKKEDGSSIVLDIIDLEPTINGYDNNDIGYKDGVRYSVEYDKAGDAYEITFFNEVAITQLLSHFGVSGTPVKEKRLTDTYSYLSFSSDITLCTSELQPILSSCDETHTIETVFPSVDAVFKYTGFWSYWKKNITNATNTYNMDILSSIDNKEGFIVKTSSVQTLKIPYNLFGTIEDDVIELYQNGWFLTGSHMDRTTTSIENMAKSQGKNLRYILRLNNNTWNVHAPLNNANVDSSLPRMNNVKEGESFWIYVE